jgi:DtxR family manganese transport transcriptional regulator
LGQDVKRIAAPAAVAEQAEGFRVTREARRNALTEDYVEMIAELIASKGEARSVDLACRFGITQATVAKTILRLKREGFVEAERYGAIHLTTPGIELAARARARHQIVVEFLKRIGVAPDVAERDAEGIEHHVSAETLQAFARLSR